MSTARYKHLDDTASLWTRFKENGDTEAREELILEYVKLVRYVAGQMAMGMPTEVQSADLETYGVFGLIDALDKFDVDRGIKFETYAVTRIRGAILDGVRKMDWVPASVRRKSREIEDALYQLSVVQGREATDEAMADHLGITVDRYRDHLLQVSQSSLMYLDEPRSKEDVLGVDRLLDAVPDPQAADPFGAAEWEVQKERLAECIDDLTEQQRMVVALYYYEGLTLSEIADIMDLSPSRISQVHSKAIMRLRGKLRTERQLFETGD